MAKGVLPIVVWSGEVVVSWEVRRGTRVLVVFGSAIAIIVAKCTLGGELTTEKLSVCQQLDEMRPIARLDVVALQVQRDVAECCRVAIDVEGSHAAGVDRC